jgi:hypothetical protein
MRDTLLDRPILHRVRNHVRHAYVEGRKRPERLAQRNVYLPWEPLPHDLVVENKTAKIRGNVKHRKPASFRPFTDGSPENKDAKGKKPFSAFAVRFFVMEKYIPFARARQAVFLSSTDGSYYWKVTTHPPRHFCPARNLRSVIGLLT